MCDRRALRYHDKATASIAPAGKRATISGETLKKSRLQIRELLSDLERDWLIGRLSSSSGVRRATYSDADRHGLIIEYDADVISCVDLMDLLHLCGLHADIVLETKRSGVLAPSVT